MPTTNLYFNNFAYTQEQNLIEDLIIESIKIYGIEVYYMPRTIVDEDLVFNEDALGKFEFAYPLEMYIKSVNGFEGEGDFLSKFGLEIRDEVVLTVARRRFSEEINYLDSTPVNEAAGIGRPAEGDLIYLPLNGKIFEVKFVEHEAIFYQMGSLQTYDLRCELFEYSSERIETGVSEIDIVQELYSSDGTFFQILTEEGDFLVTEDTLDRIYQDDVTPERVDKNAKNTFYGENNSDFIDFSEINPFSEGGQW
jgi:hypothetical protein